MDNHIRFRRYKKDFTYSYSFGVFPTLELLLHRPKTALGVIAHPKGAENAGIHKIQSLCNSHRIPFEYQEKAFQRIGARDNDYAVGIFNKSETNLEGDANHIVLVNPSGMGNLGTIQRTMLGFDFNQLAIIQPAADIFHPDVVRASMGAFFQLDLERFDSYEAYRQKYPRQSYPLMTDGKTHLREVSFKHPYSLIFGNESTGLPRAFHLIGTSVKIDQSKKIDSLNIAISVGICLYEARNKER